MKQVKFCPLCKGQLQMKKREDKERLVCTDCGYVHYVNSKPCVAVLVEQDGRLMLTRRGIEPFRGWWDLPGGFLEDGEHPEEGVRREIMEETGLCVKVACLTGIHMDTYGETGVSTLNFHYLAHVTGGQEAPKSDVEMIRWFPPDHLPGRIAFENCRIAVENWKRMKISNKPAEVL